MFEELSVHPKILVTGPCRSGTTIVGKMIEHDTGHRYVDETEFSIFKRHLFDNILLSDKVVVQCPMLFTDIVDNPPPDVFVVVMRRSVDDIKSSYDRILRLQDLRPVRLAAAPVGSIVGLNAGADGGVIAGAVYNYWDSHAKSFSFVEVQYEDIKAHPLYIGAEERAGFDIKQTCRG